MPDRNLLPHLDSHEIVAEFKGALVRPARRSQNFRLLSRRRTDMGIDGESRPDACKNFSGLLRSRVIGHDDLQAIGWNSRPPERFRNDNLVDQQICPRCMLNQALGNACVSGYDDRTAGVINAVAERRLYRGVIHFEGCDPDSIHLKDDTVVDILGLKDGTDGIRSLIDRSVLDVACVCLGKV